MPKKTKSKKKKKNLEYCKEVLEVKAIIRERELRVLRR